MHGFEINKMFLDNITFADFQIYVELCENI